VRKKKARLAPTSHELIGNIFPSSNVDRHMTATYPDIHAWLEIKTFPPSLHTSRRRIHHIYEAA